MNKIKIYFRSLGNALKTEISEHRSSFFVYSLLRALVILVLIASILTHRYENIFVCVLTLLLFIVPSFIQLTFKIELPIFLEVLILVFIFSAQILGELGNYYFNYPYWDTLLHTTNGFACAAIGFSLVALLNKNDKIQFFVSPIFLAIVSFCFSMTIGVLWEFFEYSMDTFFGMDTQKDTLITDIHSAGVDQFIGPFEIEDIETVEVNGEVISEIGYIDIGLIDTMEDLFVNFIGATVFSIFAFFYSKNSKHFSFIRYMIPTKKEEDKDYLKAEIQKEKGVD